MKNLVQFINESLSSDKGLSALTKRMTASCKRQFVGNFATVMELMDDDIDLITSNNKELENCYGGIKIGINPELIKKFADCLYKNNNNHAVKDSAIYELEKQDLIRFEILFVKDKKDENTVYVLDWSENELLDNSVINQFISTDDDSDEPLTIDSYAIRDIIIVYTALLCGVKIDYDKRKHSSFKDLINLLKAVRIVK